MPYNKEYMKQYYQQNIDIIKERQSSRVECGCGKNVTKRHYAAHAKTPQHRMWLETIPPIESN